MAKKFFMIERSLLTHWLWKSSEPFDKRSAWVDLIGMAAYIDHEGKNYEGKITVLKRGEIHTSIAALAEKWKWDRRKVKRFLAGLADEGMVSFISTTNGKTGGTVITVEKYDIYQGQRTVNSTVNGTTSAQCTPSVSTVNGTYHNKGNKEIKNISNNNNAHEEPKKRDTWYWKIPKTGIPEGPDEETLKILRGEK